MQIAVSIYSLQFFSLCQCKGSFRTVAGGQPSELCSMTCLYSDPFDPVSFCHGMSGGADLNLYHIVFNVIRRNVLFHSSIGDTGFQKFHLFAAAHNGNLMIGHLHDDIATMLANIEIHIIYTFLSQSESEA